MNLAQENLARPSWRSVPMPERIAALPRSAGGLPVPFVAQWEGEDEVAIRPCEFAGRRAIFPLKSQVGVTRPVFGVMEPSRQRAVLASTCCQVCRAWLGDMTSELEDGRPPLWLVDMLHEPATFRGHRLAIEPWVCDECLVYALQVCPGLVGAGKAKNVLAVWTANLVSPIIQPPAPLNRQPPCVGYLKVEPLRFLRIGADTILAYGPAEIREMIRDEIPKVGSR